MDKSILDNTRQNANLDRIRKSFIQGDPAATLCVEFYGDKKEDLPPRLVALEEDLRARKLGYRYHTDTDPVTQTRIWSLREAALGLSMAMKEDAKSISFVEDTAVAPEKLQRVHRPVSGPSCAITGPRPASTRTLPWAVCMSGRWST